MSEALLKELIAKVDALTAKVNRIAGVAPVWKLDGERGDPEVRFDPKIWRGESFKGMRFSDTTPEFLDMLAESYDWMAANPKQGKEQYAGRDRDTAALARGWAERKRGGWQPARAKSRAAAAQPAASGYGGGGGYGASAGSYGSGSKALGDTGSGGPDSDIPFASPDISHDLHRCGLI